MLSETKTLISSFFKGPKRFIRDFQLSRKSMQQRFLHIFQTNKWGDPDSRSGTGSNFKQTEALRAELPAILNTLGTQSLLDIPCGDFYWMKEVPLEGIHYIGADIVPEIIEANQSQNTNNSNREFMVCDLVAGQLPKADTVFCRDCLVHLSYDNIEKALANIKASGATWLITTSFKGRNKNRDIMTGKWRALDMQASPFNWPQPEAWIFEKNTEKNGRFADKHMGVWKIANLP